MEKIKLPMITLLVLMVALGVILQVLRPERGLGREKTLQKVPDTFGDWRVIHSSYWAPPADLPEDESFQKAIKELKPDEYLARFYQDEEGETLDFSVIASSHTGAFHNPQVCFRAQQWQFTENESDVLEVPGLAEKIPIKVVRVVRTNDPNQKSIGLYFYRTPLGFYSDTTSARVLMFIGRLLDIKQRAFFVRVIIPSRGDYETDVATLKKCAAELFSRLKETNPEIIH